MVNHSFLLMIFSSTTPLPSLFTQLLIHKAVDRLARLLQPVAPASIAPPVVPPRLRDGRTILDGVTGSEGPCF